MALAHLEPAGAAAARLHAALSTRDPEALGLLLAEAKLDAGELVAQLQATDFAVRFQAAQRLMERGRAEGEEVLHEALGRPGIDGLLAFAQLSPREPRIIPPTDLRLRLRGGDSRSRLAVVRLAERLAAAPQLAILSQCVHDPDPAVRREAASVLGRIAGARGPEGTSCHTKVHVCGSPEFPDLVETVDTAQTLDLTSPDTATPSDFADARFRYQLAGAIMVDGQGRLCPAKCPGKPHIMPSSDYPLVTNKEQGTAKWDCAEPDFYFGDTYISGNKTTILSLKSSTQRISVTLPVGYECANATYYLNDIGKVADAFGVVPGDPRSCWQEVRALAETGPNLASRLFFWFYVKKTS